ncbi:MAG: cation:proton antiporter [Sedimentisphaerales bacterium]|nr:cation:proton antiporter [Sedimentisphaerales bacterium]
MHYLSEEHIFLFLVQVFLLLGLSRGLGQIFTRFKQPALTAEILVGVFLGPTILGRIAPSLQTHLFPAELIQQNMLETVAWLGVLFLLLEMGLEMDFISAWRQRGDAVKIALSDIIIPMVVAFVPAMLIPDKFLTDPNQRLVFALFMAAALTISAMPVAARALHDLRLSKTDLGFLIMSALSVNDIIGWFIFTLVLALFTRPEMSFMQHLLIMALTIIFSIICLTLGRFGSSAVIHRIKRHNLPEPASSLTFICLLGLACGAITTKIGIHALFGFFIAGIMAGQSPALSERTRQIISQMVYAIFVPLFFANIGLKIDFLKSFNWLLVLVITVVGIGGRFLGAWIGVKLTKIGKANRLSIAIAHTPGGAMEIVVGILALEYGVISEPIFVAIVFGAVISSIILGPSLAYSIKRRPQISVLEFFSRTDIIPSIKAHTREHAIEELADLAAEHESISAVQQLRQAVLNREKAMGTAMEEGIAVPHARTDLIKKPLVVVGRSQAGIDWDSPDGKEAQLIFLILTPQSDDETQVQILGHIARVMSDSSVREELNNAPDSATMWDIIHKALRTQVVKKKP